MTTSKLKRSATLALLTPALLATPAQVATPASASPARAVLACKIAAADGLTYTVIKTGKGEKPGADAKVKVNYKGMLTSDGSEFDSGQGFSLPVSSQQPVCSTSRRR
jgi:FKBP-type peptidyl-prolyl cis-trans isomerase